MTCMWLCCLNKINWTVSFELMQPLTLVLFFCLFWKLSDSDMRRNAVWIISLLKCSTNILVYICPLFHFNQLKHSNFVYFFNFYFCNSCSFLSCTLGNYLSNLHLHIFWIFYFKVILCFLRLIEYWMWAKIK